MQDIENVSNHSDEENSYFIDMKWENLNVIVNGRTILSNNTGFAKHGEIYAIMGPSGNQL